MFGYVSFYLSFATACFGPTIAFAQDQQARPSAEAGFAVVELFTSEGCSSCPPADIALGKIAAAAQRDGKPIYALAFHVDYWDYLGWKDPYAAKAFSLRQRTYGRHLGRNIYTPQMIVNGRVEFVGSKQRYAEQVIQDAMRSRPQRAVVLDLSIKTTEGASVSVAYEVTGAVANDKLHLAVVEDRLVSKVSRGENKGRTLRHDGVVRVFQTIALTPGAVGTTSLALPKNLQHKHARIIGYVQAGEVGPVFAVTQVELGAITRELP